jgi:hypothetical protein
MKQHRTKEARDRADRAMRQFIKDVPWHGSAPGPLDINDYDEGSRRAVYADYKNVRL